MTTTMQYDPLLAAFLQAAVPVVQADAATGRFVGVNRALCDLVGRSASELSSLSYVDVTHPEDVGTLRAAVQACLADASDRWSVVQRIVRPDGSLRWGRVTGHVFRKDGRPFRAIGIVEDITPATLERDRLLRETRESSRLKDEFLSTLSHELRTPLNAILGWSQILLGTVDDSVRRRGLEAIARNAAAQARIVEDILDVSHFVGGRLALHRRVVELAPVVRAAVEAARPAAAGKGLALHTDFRGSVRVNGDARRLQQVFSNLLSNAVKFTPGGRIRLTFDATGDAATVTVEDTGVGIDPVFLPRVFDRFSQADGSLARPHGGLGLGLAIVRHLVELHGGTIAAESPGLGLGARFTVSLPAAPSSGARPVPHAAA
jgi:PAS domain S-box-containing protein